MSGLGCDTTSVSAGGWGTSGFVGCSIMNVTPATEGPEDRDD